MSKSLNRVRAALSAAGIETEIRELSDGTRTAEAAAAAVGCAIDQIAKSIIFHDEAADGIVLFVTAGGKRVDPARARAVAGVPLSRADPATVRRLTGFAIGGVAPLGHLSTPRAFFDPHLMTFDTVWAAAGTPHHVFSVNPARLATEIGAQVSDFTAISNKM
ncbi:YbaK/EbsC family protein [Ovoidimarina sediminis]|uniref:YbaK/EbsC family protein n=1 Tax=Ovoidimarina sediminis TaxID=3079856 RepID=UPI00290D49D5|nr:YbaK/EbsC family protein [Rhodophyticola sp. MJ-SS7]MDU8945352.1 YbaK/EbsC family protein [Rhodophyticola sp. MJ-SS7]